MDTETVITENHKKGRVRRKQTLNTILNQMHFYFSDSNLSKDRFLSQKLQESEYIDLSVFLTFNKISKLTSSVEEIAKAIKKSDLLQLDEECLRVKRTKPLKVKANVDECTIYVQTLQPDTTHDWLINVFSEFGKVEYVSLPKYSHNKLVKGFAFIEYETEQQVQAALAYFEVIGGRISLQIDGEELCSNKTDEYMNNQQAVEANSTDDKTKGEEEPVKEEDINERKRKHSENEENIDGSEDGKEKTKKIKTEDSLEVNEEEEVKQKKKSSKRKALIKELGLQVLTKLEWKKLRNRYWEMQRKKMKQLKQHLTKRRLHQSNYLDIKNPQKSQENKPNEEKSNESIPGVIVKLKLFEPWTDAKKIKNELKNTNGNIQYVEVPVTLTSDEVYLRFASAESALEYCTTKVKGEGVVLQDDEEKQYWEKIKMNRDAHHNKDVKKQRGRDKLLKRAERELGKHIRFDDTGV